MKSTGPKLLPPPTKPAVLDDISAVCLQEYMVEMDSRAPAKSSASVTSGGATASVSQEVNTRINAIDEKNKAYVYLYDKNI